MIKVSEKLYSFIALLFVFLSLLGYQLATMILLPSSSDVDVASSSVTYPYRAIVFALSFFLIVTSPINKGNKLHKKEVFVYIVFMLLYYVRILIDIFGRGVYLQPGFQRVVIQYMFIVMIPSIWATGRCARNINFEKLNQWLVVGGIVLLGVTVWNQNVLIASEYDEMIRGEGNIALNSISFGHACVSLIVIFLSWVVCHKKEKRLGAILLVLLMFLSFVMMLRIASRGPLVAFVVVIAFFLFSGAKNKLFGLIISLLVVLFVWSNLSTIIGWLGSISPMMEQRMAEAIFEKDSSGRDILFHEAISIFLQNPILGKQFVLNNGFYPHNSILDVMIGLGIFGALVWIFLILKTWKFGFINASNKNSLMTISLLSVQFIIKGFFSGAMYTQNDLAVCMLIVLATTTNNASTPLTERS